MAGDNELSYLYAPPPLWPVRSGESLVNKIFIPRLILFGEEIPRATRAHTGEKRSYDWESTSRMLMFIREEKDKWKKQMNLLCLKLG